MRSRDICNSDWRLGREPPVLNDPLLCELADEERAYKMSDQTIIDRSYDKILLLDFAEDEYTGEGTDHIDGEIVREYYTNQLTAYVQRETGEILNFSDRDEEIEFDTNDGIVPLGFVVEFDMPEYRLDTPDYQWWQYRIIAPEDSSKDAYSSIHTLSDRALLNLETVIEQANQPVVDSQ